MFHKISPFGRNDKKENYVIPDLIRNPDALSFLLAPFEKGGHRGFLGERIFFALSL